MLHCNPVERLVTIDSDDSPHWRIRLGIALVALQFASIAAIAWPGSGGGWSWSGAALILAGALLGLWTLSVNRPGNFNIRPEIKPSGKLVLTGPYRYVRHPMYSALLLLISGIASFHTDRWRWLALAVLAAALFAKTLLEECALKLKFPEYADYSRGVGRFIPRLSSLVARQR